MVSCGAGSGATPSFDLNGVACRGGLARGEEKGSLLFLFLLLACYFLWEFF